MSMSNDPNVDMEAMQAQILQSLNRESLPFQYSNTVPNSSEASVLQFLENMDPHDAEVVQANLRSMPTE